MPEIRPAHDLDAASAGRGRRWSRRRRAALAVTVALGALTAAVAVAGADPYGGGGGGGGGGGNGGGDDQGFRQLNLVSDVAGMARITDPNLVNPWGLAAGPHTPLWVADNGTDLSTVYGGGVGGSKPVALPLVVRIPGGAPTGIVFNRTNGFAVSGSGASAPARFVFASEGGNLTGWSPEVPTSDEAHPAVTTPDAIYKGLAIFGVGHDVHLYAADFHHARIDVFDEHFDRVDTPGAFVDPGIPEGYAPFNVEQLGDLLYVTYAKQDESAKDDVAGEGFGFVDVYTPAGHLIKRLVSNGELNAPWGLALAPSHFGAFGGDLLVGNFGDGRINAYNPQTGNFEGRLTDEHGNPIEIDELWALRFGNGTFGTPDALVFTAGIGEEQHGLLGEIMAR
jgi:uncharacterized protein (TIGR03118 family)